MNLADNDRTRIVKIFVILAALTVAAMRVNAQSWQDVSATLFTNAEIVWQVPSNAMPKNLWVYRRILPHVFPASVVSNAIVLGSLEKRGIPIPSTNDFHILQEVPPNWPAPIPTLFGMIPKDAYLYFSVASYAPVSPKDIPDDRKVMKLARDYAPRLGIASAELTNGKFYTHRDDADSGINICGRGIFFPRQLDGISFFSADDTGDGAEGFCVEFGKLEKVQAFSVRWSDMRYYKNERVANIGEITRCILAHKVIVMPNFRDNDFAWLKSLAKATKLTIVKITPRYGVGMFGEVLTNDIPCPYARPFVELDAIAELEGKDVPMKLLSPILSADVARLTKQ